MRSTAELTAYYAFLWSEKIRHQEDIDQIDKKLMLLEKMGIKSDVPGDWISEQELVAGGCD